MNCIDLFKPVKEAKAQQQQPDGLKRMPPALRRQQLLLAAVGLAVGQLPWSTDKPIHFLMVGHTEIAEVCKVSVALVFSHFKTTEELRDAIKQWAIDNLYEPDKYVRLIVEDLVKQLLSTWPQLGDELDLVLTIETTAEV